MKRIEAIETAVRALTPEEFATFRIWFAEFEADVWDRQIETDARAGKLDAPAEAALKAHKARRGTSL